MKKHRFLLISVLVCWMFPSTALPSSFLFTPQPFNRLEILGPLDVCINSGSKKNTVWVSGNPQALKKLNIQTKRGLLHLSTSQKSRITINIHLLNQGKEYDSNSNTVNSSPLTNSLNLITGGNTRIYLRGRLLRLSYLKAFESSHVTAVNIQAPYLSVIAQTTGQIRLNGKIGLRQLILNGRGPVFIDSIASPSLKMLGYGYNTAQLSGNIGTLNADLNGYVSFFSPKLFVQEGFIKTRGYAYIQARFQDRLKAFADDHSTIYYSPETRIANDYTKNQGLVGRITF